MTDNIHSQHLSPGSSFSICPWDSGDGRAPGRAVAPRILLPLTPPQGLGKGPDTASCLCHCWCHSTARTRRARQTRPCSALPQTETGTWSMVSKMKQRPWKLIDIEWRKPKLSCFKWIKVGLKLILLWVHALAIQCGTRFSQHCEKPLFFTKKGFLPLDPTYQNS